MTVGTRKDPQNTRARGAGQSGHDTILDAALVCGVCALVSSSIACTFITSPFL